MIDFSLSFALHRFLILVLMVSAPVVIAAFLVGILVGIAQAVTQVQDQSIAYGIKIAVVIVILIAFGSWMAQEVLAVFDNGFDLIPEVGRGSLPR
ncbi:flagellar biosynthetic protein FliQ [Collimonas sp. H4R21]|uniref:Flagellar biosynthetic protein FliQ n=1 Tax=Collimonas rhizosphaerae TaxID=3126357 RepID=A0ABU9PYM9_9BURK